MKPAILLPLASLALALASDGRNDDGGWIFDYQKWCIFEQSDAIGTPEPCREYYRITRIPADNGMMISNFTYMWRRADGREVTYDANVGIVGVSNFTIGTLTDNRHERGPVFDPAVSHSDHRESIVIGVPNDGYEFAACNREFDPATGRC